MTSRRNLLWHGLRITLRSGRAVLWTYAFNLGITLLFLLRFRGQLADVLNHSLASQRLVGAFDLGTTAEAIFSLSEGHSGGTTPNYLSIPVFLLVYFVLVPGTLFCYQTRQRARLSTLLHQGLLFFWRFVRITLLSLLVSGLILGLVGFFHRKFSDAVDEHVLGRPGFLLSLAGMLVVLLIAAALRLYFDLVEVYTVQLGLELRPGLFGQSPKPDRRVRRTLRPAFRTLVHNHHRTYLSFVFLTFLGLLAVFLTGRVALHTLAQPRVWPAFLVFQFGLFINLFTRFWQRGMETVLAQDNPLTPPVQLPIARPYPPPHPTPMPDRPADHPQQLYNTDPLDYIAPARPLDPLTAAGGLDPAPALTPNPNPDPAPAPAQAPLDPPFAESHPRPTHPAAHEPLPDPEPPSPSLSEPDPGVFHHEPKPPRE